MFTAVQKAIATGGFPPPPPEPAHIPKASYGSVTLTESALLFANLASLGTCNVAVGAGASFPSMEDLKSWYGFVLYHTSTTTQAAATPEAAAAPAGTNAAGFDATSIGFTSINTHDRVQVFVDNVEVGSAYRADGKTSVAAPAGKSMSLLLENMGRCEVPSFIGGCKCEAALRVRVCVFPLLSCLYGCACVGVHAYCDDLCVTYTTYCLSIYLYICIHTFTYIYTHTYTYTWIYADVVYF